MTVAVVGRSSLLGQAVARRPETRGWSFLSHGQVLAVGLPADTGTVVNFALAPAYTTNEYDPALDFERTLSALCAERGCRYVMISSRKVYDPDSGFVLAESAPLRGHDAYGRNKLVSERLLQEALGERLTILRLGNVIGFDWDWRRRIFVARMLRSLKNEGRIVYDVSPFTRRDFMTDDAVARAVVAVAERGLAGVYNLGSGTALPIGRLALWAMEGFGAGELVVVDPRERDEFVLDVRRLEAAIGPLCGEEELHAKCLGLGRELRDA